MEQLKTSHPARNVCCSRPCCVLTLASFPFVTFSSFILTHLSIDCLKLEIWQSRNIRGLFLHIPPWLIIITFCTFTALHPLHFLQETFGVYLQKTSLWFCLLDPLTHLSHRPPIITTMTSLSAGCRNIQTSRNPYLHRPTSSGKTSGGNLTIRRWFTPIR